MMYDAYQAQSDFLAPLRLWAGVANAGLKDIPARFGGQSLLVRASAAAADIFAHSRLTHDRPPYGVDSVVIGGETIAITEEPVSATPFATLLHFKKSVAIEQPRMLLVAPMAGHFPTLLRDTVRTLLVEHDVYITDWTTARDVPVSDGVFGLDEYITHMIDFMRDVGPGSHVMAVCQPCVALLAAVSLMSEDKDPCTPLSMTLMAGPIDTSINPTKVNDLATSNPLSWFERNLITTVPYRYEGAGRRVYPGFLQLTAFMSMNIARHMRAHFDLFEHIVKGDMRRAEQIRNFYDEYFAVFDLPADFYLETVQQVFQEYRLARGTLEYKGRLVNPGAIKKTALLTIEGERDDICSVGQTMAAQDLCTGIKPFKKKHYVQPGVGHYGVFAGSKWQTQIYPMVRNLVLASD
jgi:polyhydroxyalkanoate depolymerase